VNPRGPFPLPANRESKTIISLALNVNHCYISGGIRQNYYIIVP
jgi:hypothetical protein